MRVRTLCALALLVVPAALAAQSPARDASSRWGLRVRAVLSGSSDEAVSGGYTVYSGVALEAAVVRWISDVAALELGVRTESREVEGPAANLGSLEMLPVNLALAWYPRGRGAGDLQPYFGGGVNLTATWEKSGALDATNPPPTVAPLLQFGADWRVADRTALNVDVRWHAMTVEIDDFVTPAPEVKVDPLALGMGLTVRF